MKNKLKFKNEIEAIKKAIEFESKINDKVYLPRRNIIDNTYCLGEIEMITCLWEVIHVGDIVYNKNGDQYKVDSIKCSYVRDVELNYDFYIDIQLVMNYKGMEQGLCIDPDTLYTKFRKQDSTLAKVSQFTIGLMHILRLYVTIIYLLCALFSTNTGVIIGVTIYMIADTILTGFSNKRRDTHDYLNFRNSNEAIYKVLKEEKEADILC